MDFGHWECLRIVGTESQGGQIPEVTGPIQWPSGGPGSTWERRAEAWDHLGALATSLRALTTRQGAHRMTVEQSGKNIFANAAGVPGTHSYPILFNSC